MGLIKVQEQIDALKTKGGLSDGYHTFDELYEFRKVYNAGLFNEWANLNLYNTHKSLRHSDGDECFGGGWFIVVAETPYGQISNHYKIEDWTLFKVEERERAIPYDGHTSQQSLERLTKTVQVRIPLTSKIVRASGKTTRLIDAVIQSFFNTGSYDFKYIKSEPPQEVRRIRDTVIDRLNREHQVNVKDGTLSTNGSIIRLHRR